MRKRKLRAAELYTNDLVLKNTLSNIDELNSKLSDWDDDLVLQSKRQLYKNEPNFNEFDVQLNKTDQQIDKSLKQPIVKRQTIKPKTQPKKAEHNYINEVVVTAKKIDKPANKLVNTSTRVTKPVKPVKPNVKTDGMDMAERQKVFEQKKDTTSIKLNLNKAKPIVAKTNKPDLKSKTKSSTKPVVNNQSQQNAVVRPVTKNKTVTVNGSPKPPVNRYPTQTNAVKPVTKTQTKSFTQKQPATKKVNLDGMDMALRLALYESKTPSVPTLRVLNNSVDIKPRQVETVNDSPNIINTIKSFVTGLDLGLAKNKLFTKAMNNISNSDKYPEIVKDITGVLSVDDADLRNRMIENGLQLKVDKLKFWNNSNEPDFQSDFQDMTRRGAMNASEIINRGIYGDYLPSQISDIKYNYVNAYNENQVLNPRKYYQPEDYNLTDGSIKFGSRNRYTNYNNAGLSQDRVFDTRPINNTAGSIITSYAPFFEYGHHALTPGNTIGEHRQSGSWNYWYGYDKNGNFIHGNDYSKFKNGDVLTKTIAHTISEIRQDENGNAVMVFPNGRTSSINYTSGTKSRDVKHRGREIIICGKEARLVSGTTSDLIRVIENMKKRHHTDKVTLVEQDNGSYSRGLKTFDGNITEEDWKDHFTRNTTNGHTMYIK